MMQMPATRIEEVDDLLTRLSLLIGQAFFLGLTLGLLIVAAIALLIATYGAGALPYVYIVVAILGSVAFYGFAEVQRRWSLVQVSIATELIIASFLAFAWAGLVFLQASWLAFASMVAFSLIIQIGFVIIGGQAGRLLDVRQIKQYFPRIVAGFVVGFMVAGALVTPIQDWLGGTEYLLLASAVSATIMMGMLLATNARYFQILSQTNGGVAARADSPPLRKVLAKPFVLLIFAYQMLSAMVSQLLDFIVLSAAGERFTDADALASFFGNLTFVLNLIDLLFLALVAGLLLNRFGLRFGLTANPAVDIFLLIAIVAAGIVGGPIAILFFWLVVIARVVDISFTDGTTRTSINATFQALPASERVTVQTGVEGIGVPLALGLTGVALLIFDALGGVTLVFVAIFTMVIALFWLVSALMVYRGYAANLVRSMRRRTLDPTDMILEDAASQKVVERLLGSEAVSDVRLALDMLEGAEYSALPQEVDWLARSGIASIQIEALGRIERLRLAAALPTVQELVDGSVDASVQGAAVRALCALQEAEAVEKVVPYLDSPESEVRLGTAVGLLRYGSIPGVLAVGPRLEMWEQADANEDRVFLARVIGEVGLEYVYQPLLSLLADPDIEVRKASLAAAGLVKHPRLLPLIADNLLERRTRAAASEAIAVYGEKVLPMVEQALVGGMETEERAVRLVRICGQIKGEQVQALMRRNLDHSSDVVRDQVMAVLGSYRFQAQPADLPALHKALIRDAGRGHRTMIAQQDVGESGPVEALRRALLDDLKQVKRRLFWTLSFIYDDRAVMRAQAQLAHGTGPEKALAMEMLDVTLSAEHKTLTFPLIDPKMDPARRILLLDKRFGHQSMYREERLQDLSCNSDQAWIRACALYAGVKLGVVGQLTTEKLVPIVEMALVGGDSVVRETAVWGLHMLAPKQFKEQGQALLADEDPYIACLAADILERQ